MQKDIKKINWEKVGVYIAIATLVIMFATKVMNNAERISYVEGKLEILMDNLKE